MNLGKSLTMALAERGIGNKEVAAGLDTTSQQITLWKKGRISHNNLVSLCVFLKIPVSEFIALGEEKSTDTKNNKIQ